MVFAPASPQEMFDLTICAFSAAEKFRTPVLIAADAFVGHRKEAVEIPKEGEVPFVWRRVAVPDEEGEEVRGFLETWIAPMPLVGRGLKAHVTASCHDVYGRRTALDAEAVDHFVRTLCEKIQRYRGDLTLTEAEGPEEAKVALVGYGSAGRVAQGRGPAGGGQGGLGDPLPGLDGDGLSDVLRPSVGGLGRGGPAHARLRGDRLRPHRRGGAAMALPREGPPRHALPARGAVHEGEGAVPRHPVPSPAEEPDEAYPMLMSTGRTLYHYNVGNMTRKTEAIDQKQPENFVEVHLKDAERIGVRGGDMVKVETRRGALTVRAVVGEKVRPGAIWMPFHFVETPTNNLTNDAFDNITATAEYKCCAARIEKP